MIWAESANGFPSALFLELVYSSKGICFKSSAPWFTIHFYFRVSSMYHCIASAFDFKCQEGGNVQEETAKKQKEGKEASKGRPGSFNDNERFI